MSYSIRILESEWRALGWLANRYEAAHILHDAAEPTNDPEVWTIEEPDAWEFSAAYQHGDGGAPCQIPCLGGRLADEVAKLYEAIV